MSHHRLLTWWGRTRLSGPVLPLSPATVFAGAGRCFSEPLTNLACASVSCFGLDLILLAFPRADADEVLLPSLLNFLARVLVLILGSSSSGQWRRSVVCAVIGEAGYDGALDTTAGSLVSTLGGLGATLPLPLEGLGAAVAALANTGGFGLVFTQAGADTFTDAAATAFGRLSMRVSRCVRVVVSGLHKVVALGLTLAFGWVRRVKRDVRRLPFVGDAAAVAFRRSFVRTPIRFASRPFGGRLHPHTSDHHGDPAELTRNLHGSTSGPRFEPCGGRAVPCLDASCLHEWHHGTAPPNYESTTRSAHEGDPMRRSARRRCPRSTQARLPGQPPAGANPDGSQRGNVPHHPHLILP